MQRALRRQGHELVMYNLDTRIARAGSFLYYNWRKSRKSDPSLPKPTQADVLYYAGTGLLERAAYHAVDWVLIFSAMYLHPNVLIMLRRCGYRTALLFSESPYDDVPQSFVAPFADVVFTNERTSVERLRQGQGHIYEGMKEKPTGNTAVYYLPHAYDPEVHHPGKPVADGIPHHQVLFVGTGFQERIDLLGAVNWDGIDFGMYGTYELLGSRAKLRQHIRGGYLDNPVTAQLYACADIGLNLYRTSQGWGRNVPRVSGAESLNPRAYELAACGVFTLSDERAEVREIFGELVPTYRNAQELEALTRRYLADEEARRAIAAQLPAAVAGHTFDARAKQVVETLAAHMPAGGASPRPAPDLAVQR